MELQESNALKPRLVIHKICKNQFQITTCGTQNVTHLHKLIDVSPNWAYIILTIHIHEKL